MPKPMTKQQIHKLYVDTFSTDSGKKCLEMLKSSFVDRPVYVKGLTFDEVAYREGGRDVIQQILKEVNNG